MEAFVEQVHDRHKIHRRAVAVNRIHVVTQSDEAYIERRKNVIYILPDLNVITTETGKVFYKYQIYRHPKIICVKVKTSYQTNACKASIL